jgi:hypothetical protein
MSYVPPHKRCEAQPALTESDRLAQWLRENQVASGPVGKVVGSEKPPQVFGYMYSSFTSVDGGADSEEVCEEIGFDHDMKKFLKNQGPPPYPLATYSQSEPAVQAYYAWYQRIGQNLADKWYRDHSIPQKTVLKPAQKPIQKPIQKSEEKPRRIIEPASEQSGW